MKTVCGQNNKQCKIPRMIKVPELYYFNFEDDFLLS